MQKAGTAGCVSNTGTSGQCADGNALVGVQGLALSPRGDTLYTASQGSDAVAVLDVSGSTGELTQKAGTAGCTSDTGSSGQCLDGTALGQPTELTASPDGQSVYVGSAGASDAVVIFDRARTGATNGEIAQKAGTAGCVSDTGSSGACQDGAALRGAGWVTTSPDGENVYSSNGVGFSDASDSIAIFDRTRDTAAPDTTITSPPSDGTSTADSTPEFQFTATEDSTFACRLDANPAVACTSPYTASAQSNGMHTLTVTATDLALNPDPSPALRTFTVDNVKPTTQPPTQAFTVGSVLGTDPSGPSIPQHISWPAGTGDATPTSQLQYRLQESVSGGPSRPCATGPARALQPARRPPIAPIATESRPVT